jgi:predicted RNA binding protein YcfA (HicA-like mRNA interferase family)
VKVARYTWLKGRGEITVKFSELVRLLEKEGFRIIKEKGSVRYYGKSGWPRLIRVDYHGVKEVPTGTCHSILKAAGIRSLSGKQRYD